MAWTILPRGVHTLTSGNLILDCWAIGGGRGRFSVCDTSTGHYVAGSEVSDGIDGAKRKAQEAAQAVQAIERMKNGERVILSDALADAIIEHCSDEASAMRTCHNRQRCGIHDGFIGWILDSAAPADLEFRDDPQRGQYAVGSR